MSATCTNGTCAASPCANGKRDGQETDVDCGGGVCPKCADGKTCGDGTDCTGGICTNMVCKSPITCAAGTANCDGNIANGCEVNTDADPKNCGRCSNVCPLNTPYCNKGNCTPVIPPCTNGSFTDCNPAKSTLISNSAFVDPSPPQDWKQCFGFVNTAGDDVANNAIDNCLQTTRLRIRFFDPNGNLTDDVYAKRCHPPHAVRHPARLV